MWLQKFCLKSEQVGWPYFFTLNNQYTLPDIQFRSKHEGGLTDVEYKIKE